jgi:hypothetical protein
MVNYRTFNAKLVTSGSSALVDNAWGVLPVNGVTGTITLEGYGTGSTVHPTIALEHLAAGQPFPCYVRSISVTNGGSVYVLA